MILFIVAFLLMALSFLMHQRSNSEVLGELQDSVSAMQEIQDTQDQILDLQKQLSDAEEDQAELESAAGGGCRSPLRTPSGRQTPCWRSTPCSSSTPPATLEACQDAPEFDGAGIAGPPP